jgi:molybdenum cofactor cytidylyltransferase
MNRSAVILLASGRSRRFGWRDKLLQDLDGQPLIAHPAAVLAGQDWLARVAVCPVDIPRIGEILQDRFVIALNSQPSRGLGHSISVGVRIARQFRPEAIVLCMADTPFLEPSVFERVLERLGGPERISIVHSGSRELVRPPTAFDAACFEALEALDGDEGARDVMRDPIRRVASTEAPEALLADIDTRADLDQARQQMEIRSRYR